MGTWTTRLMAIVLASMPCVVASAGVSAGSADTSTEFVDGASVALAPGQWDGRLRFADVYCTTFPDADRATMRTSALLNGNAVSLVKVNYPDAIAAYLVSSTLPPGRDAHQEHDLQRERARHAGRQVPGLLAFHEMDSDMGKVLVQRYTNVAEFGPGSAMFPLEIHALDAGDRTVTVAESRVFTRVPDRFEVAILAAVASDALPAEVERVRARATDLATRLQASLQSCTGTLPPRTP